MVQAAHRRVSAFSLGRDFARLSAWPRPGALLPLVLALAAGCSGRAKIEEANYSPAEAAQQAIRQYDKNGDGVLDAKELEQCPALLDLLRELDSKEDKSSGHKSGELRGAEIQSRMEAFQQRHVALMGVGCRVWLDGEPLAGATITLVPEEFLGPAFKPARGVSDAQGVVQLITEGYDKPGVMPGYYRIEVSKKDGSDHESLPDKYNAHTTLGREVSPLSRVGMTIKIGLTTS